MIFRFLILSDEADNFKREIKIDADASFYDLFKAIVDCTGYNDKEISSFFICNENWRKQQEITLVEMDTDPDEDSYVMESTILSDFLDEEKQKLMFVFDYVNDRALYIELSEIITGKSLKKPQCTISEGEAPEQFVEIDDIVTNSDQLDIDESFYGDEGFNLDELDQDGFDGLEGMTTEIDNADLY